MLKVDKKDEPEFFSKFKKKNGPKDWKDLDFEIKRKLKKYMLENEQKIDDKSYCPYCEMIISSENNDLKEDKKCHIEHIKPKSKFPNLAFDYRNFLTSCSDKNTCGHCKQSDWDNKLFINPIEENPEEYFSYSIRTGKIIPKKEAGLEYEKAIKTIEILNLNENKLCDYRKSYINQILNSIKNSRNDDEKIEIINYFDELPTLKKFLIGSIKILEEMI
ncbi:retron system putative HNH endonuclease [Leptotrichia hongkongensis]|uniref:retron system putative HNH endonuclease n=1 Tax=Leptotrichia hongkongensis TaxID=554406 RepID=UPI0035A88C5D